MRWFFGIALVIFSFGVLSVGDKAPGVEISSHLISANQAETVDVFILDFNDFFKAKVRVRNYSGSNQRIKNDRIFEWLEPKGLVFLTCKIAKSYSEIHIDKYLKLLFQYTIQVNAP